MARSTWIATVRRLVLSAFLSALLFVLLSDGAHALTLSNPSPISINSVGPATPYPSTIIVTGTTGTITDVNVTLSGLSHSFVNDVGVLLVGPGGQAVVLLDAIGGRSAVSNATYTIDDEAANTFPSAGSIPSGSYKPTNFAPADVFAPPAPTRLPGQIYGSALSLFDGNNANGTWLLFVFDFVPQDSGSLSGGWSLDIQEISSVPEPRGLVLMGWGLAVLGLVGQRWRT